MTTQTFRLDRPRNPLVQLVPTPQPIPPRRTVGTVIQGKLLNWLAEATWNDIRKLLVLLGTVLLIAGLVFSANFTLGMLTTAAKWNGYRIPLFLALLALTLNARRIVRLVTRKRLQRKGANQHTYHGLPVDELASYLIEHQSFKRDDAMSRFGITQPKHVSISKELEHHQVLVRGESNARVLNVITREQLVRQLRDKFPLEFHQGEWCQRGSSWERHLRAEDRQEQEAERKLARAERRAKKAQAVIDQAEELKRAEGFAYRSFVTV